MNAVLPSGAAPATLFIAGEWRAASNGRVYEVFNPATGAAAAAYAAASPDDVADGIIAAIACKDRMKAMSVDEKAAILKRAAEILRDNADNIARQIVVENGKPFKEAKGEVMFGVSQLEWHADFAAEIKAEHLAPAGASSPIVRYDPIGVVAALTPWNAPFAMPARHIAMPFCAGCPVIIKPAEEAPGACLAIVDAMQKAGAPAGAVTMIAGDAPMISEQLMAESEVRLVAFTGSTHVGKLLMKQAAATAKRTLMELGGHAPVIICEDATEDVAKILADGKFKSSGQNCVSPTRFYVHESRYEAFVKNFVDAVNSIKVGDGLDEAVNMGPLTTARRRDDIVALCKETIESGAVLQCGGSVPVGLEAGYFFAPTVFSNVTDDMRVMGEEVFGPIAPIASFSSLDEVIKRANASELGLGGYVFTKSQATADFLANALEVGMVGVNALPLSFSDSPFGGVKSSGVGRVGGRWGVYEYLEPKLINNLYVE